MTKNILSRNYTVVYFSLEYIGTVFILTDLSRQKYALWSYVIKICKCSPILSLFAFFMVNFKYSISSDFEETLNNCTWITSLSKFMVGREWGVFSARCVSWHEPVRLVSVAEFTKDWIAHTVLSANVHPPKFHIGIITEMPCKLNFYICSFSVSHQFWLTFFSVENIN